MIQGGNMKELNSNYNNFKITGNKELDVIINAYLRSIRFKKSYLNDLRHVAEIFKKAELEPGSYNAEIHNTELADTELEIVHVEATIQRYESRIVQYLGSFFRNILIKT